MSSTPAPELRPAATILLVRDTAAGVEVFMERRHHQSGFVAGAYVFPGGRVDASDTLVADRCIGLDEAAASRSLGVAAGGLAFYIAAIRECFEEAGVLLAYDRSGDLLDFGTPEVEARYRGYRDQLNAGQVALGDLLVREDLRLATDRLGYWAHWITPFGESRRFDTRFFIAKAPEAQVAGHDDWELTDSAWIRPADALDRARRREWTIILPTLMNLRALAAHPTADAALAWAAGQPTPLPANLPRVFDGRIVLPGDPDYARGEADIRKVDRAVLEGRSPP